MREIKFRAWDKERKEMCIVTRLEFAIGGDAIRGQFGWYGGGWEEVEGALLKNRRYVLMQYTGLRDVNGREIYEGDIVEDGKGKRYEVRWCNSYAGFSFESDEEAIPFLEIPFPSSLKVIGNIYENPELLKKGGKGD